MGLQVRGNFYDRPFFRGAYHNAFLNGEKVWVRDPVRPITTDWAPVVLRVNDPDFIIPLNHYMYGSTLSPGFWSTVGGTIQTETWEISVDLGKTWTEHSGIQGNYIMNSLGGIQLTNIPVEEDMITGDQGYWIGIRPKFSQTQIDDPSSEVVESDFGYSRPGWFGPFGFYAAEVTMTNNSGSYINNENEPLIQDSFLQSSAQANRNKLVEIHVNPDGTTNHPIIRREVWNIQSNRSYKLLRGYLHAWLYKCTNLEVINFDTDWFDQIPMTGWNNNTWDNQLPAFVYNFCFGDCVNLKRINFRFEDFPGMISGNGQYRSMFRALRRAGTQSYPSGSIPYVTQSDLISKLSGGNTKPGDLMSPFGSGATSARIDP